MRCPFCHELQPQWQVCLDCWAWLKSGVLLRYDVTTNRSKDATPRNISA